MTNLEFVNKKSIDDYCEKKNVKTWLQHAIYGVNQTFPYADIKVYLHPDADADDEYIVVEYNVDMDSKSLDKNILDAIDSIHNYYFMEMITCTTDGFVTTIPKFK